jgi:hypothetical protein
VNITASSLERLDACSASAALPQASYSDGGAKRGTENHEDAERGKLHPKIAEFLSDVTDQDHEVSFVLDTKTRTVRTTGTRRAYGKLTSYEVGTTPDIVGVKGDAIVTVDFKSRSRVTRAQSNWQIKTHALVAKSLCDEKVTRVISGLAYLDDGELDLHEFSAISLSAAWIDLHDICARIERVKKLPLAELSPVAGGHCTYCGALALCPTQKALVNTFNQNYTALTQEDVNARFALMTAEQIEDADNAIRNVERMLDMAKAGRFSRLELGPVKLRDGKYLKLIQSSNKKTDWQGLDEELSKHGKSLADFQAKTTYMKPARVNNQ